MRLNDLHWFATAAFGLEGIVAAELKRLGLRDVLAQNGGAAFTGSPSDAFRACLWLRSADRVLLVLAQAEARTFEELFQLVKSVPWEAFLPGNARIPVTGKCARSQLMSVRDCQAITKKAIVERLRHAWHAERLPETGVAYPVDIALHGDVARLTLDACGDALNRRGYRTWNGEAPLRETLAASLLEISPWRPGLALHDPCCGTGTLLIEAAFKQARRAPGLFRPFAMEQFSFFSQTEADALRAQAREVYDPERIHDLSGSDIDPEPLTLAKRHVVQAQLGGRIELTRQPLETLQLSGAEGVFIANPPYGERLSDRKSCERLYGELRRLKERHPGWALCAISSHPGFERWYGKRADKVRRLYNGRLECNFFIYKA